ncbi:hypothetical protein FQN60_016007 [Etheostoma spectabile]|uniref:Uncharacterized protein n=1 Tax=Etheostoma spectabile TaxID=54343 RepID=A0A5J5CAB2_9PERO|nr:hypothetical protein FQN60_016007 [Etheostoma spectabile]
MMWSHCCLREEQFSVWTQLALTFQGPLKLCVKYQFLRLLVEASIQLP